MIDLLREQLQLLEKGEKWLQHSYDKLDGIDLNQNLSIDQFDLLDNLSTRFMRLYQVLINQLLRTYLNMVGEEQLTRIDVFNKADKLGLCEKAQDLNFCRIVRNKIAHEYAAEEWKLIYQDTFKGIEILRHFSLKFKQSINERGWMP